MRNIKKTFLICSLVIGTLLAGCGIGKGEETTEEITSPPSIECDEKENEKDVNDVEEDTISTLRSGEIIFETEYTIEEYQQGRFIVSKNDGLLYGVLGLEGEEIIPVKYDDIIFLNDENIEKGIGANILFLAKYEDCQIIFDVSGKELCRTTYNISEILYSSKSSKMSACGCFWINNIDMRCIYIYDEMANVIAEIDYEGYEEVKLYSVSPDCYILDLYHIKTEGVGHVSVHYDGAVLFNGQFEIVEKSSMAISNVQRKKDSEMLFLWYLLGDEYQCWIIDSDANLHEKNCFENYEDYSADVLLNYNYGKTNYEDIMLGEIHLYKSNGTWKLEDAKGQALYNERYFDCLSKEGSYFLMNEDNALCVIDNRGNLIIDFGCLIKMGKDVYFEGTSLSTDDYLVGDDGVVITKWNGEKFLVYYYFNDEYRKELIAHRANYSIKTNETVKTEIEAEMFKEY